MNELLHELVLKRDNKALKRALRKGKKDESFDVNALDRHGNTALHIAVHLLDFDAVELLIAHGASCNVKSSAHWRPMPICRSTGSVRMTKRLGDAAYVELGSMYRARLPSLFKSLRDLDDFSLVIDWKFKSWVPLTGRFCPQDRCVVRKYGSSLRLDFTLIGFEGMKWQYGSLSAIFSGEDTSTPGQLAVVNWNDRTVRIPAQHMSGVEPSQPHRTSTDDAALLLSNEIVVT